MTDDCIFCKIANGDIDAEFVYEDEHVVAFADMAAQAPVHVLIIPRHFSHSLNVIERLPALR